MSNPVLARAAFANAGITPAEGRMTLAGAVTKTGALMAGDDSTHALPAGDHQCINSQSSQP
jgi:hypothetical protein